MERPELRWRHEWKYWISWEQYHVLRCRLRALLRPDPNVGPSGEYRVRSLYFDTIGEDHAFEKLSGINRRAKFRIRTYGEVQDWARLEIKHRKGHRVSKESVRLSREESIRLAQGRVGLDKSRSPILSQLKMALRRGIAQPAVIVDYIREPYIQSAGNVRITFDKQLSTSAWNHSLFDEDLPLLPVRGEGAMILEVKYDAFLPLAIKRVFPNSILGPMAISKYIFCRPVLQRWDDCA
jgi:hypothetical protein